MDFTGNLVEMVEGFIKPELFLMVPVLMFIGYAIKKGNKIKDELIPLLLGVASVLISSLYVVATSVIACWQDVLLLLFTAITQGILLAGLSVYIHQMKKQLGER